MVQLPGVIDAKPFMAVLRSAERARLSPTEFWQLLLTQLQLQDPFEITDTTDMVQQLMTLQSASELARLSENLEHVRALLLLGQRVTLKDGQMGTVTGVSFREGVRLTLRLTEGMTSVPLSSISSVQILSGRLQGWA